LDREPHTVRHEKAGTQRDRLHEAVRACWLQPDLLVYRSYVVRSQIIAARTGIAALQQIAGEEFEVSADRCCVDGRRILDGGRSRNAARAEDGQSHRYSGDPVDMECHSAQVYPVTSQESQRRDAPSIVHSATGARSANITARRTASTCPSGGRRRSPARNPGRAFRARAPRRVALASRRSARDRVDAPRCRWAPDPRW
jgi:hypothetical protein